MPIIDLEPLHPNAGSLRVLKYLYRSLGWKTETRWQIPRNHPISRLGKRKQSSLFGLAFIVILWQFDNPSLLSQVLW